MEGVKGEGIDLAPRLLLVYLHKAWCPSLAIPTGFHRAQHRWMEEWSFTVYWARQGLQSSHGYVDSK